MSIKTTQTITLLDGRMVLIDSTDKLYPTVYEIKLTGRCILPDAKSCTSFKHIGTVHVDEQMLKKSGVLEDVRLTPVKQERTLEELVVLMLESLGVVFKEG